MPAACSGIVAWPLSAELPPSSVAVTPAGAAGGVGARPRMEPWLPLRGRPPSTRVNMGSAGVAETRPCPLARGLRCSDAASSGQQTPAGAGQACLRSVWGGRTSALGGGGYPPCGLNPAQLLQQGSRAYARRPQRGATLCCPPDSGASCAAELSRGQGRASAALGFSRSEAARTLLWSKFHGMCSCWCFPEVGHPAAS